jgi:hypothetical protein
LPSWQAEAPLQRSVITAEWACKVGLRQLMR